MSKPIFLIGPPGVGKTTTGSRLAKLYGWDFFDTDRLIEERTGVRISDIFEIEGEEGFRTRETRILEEISEHQDAVIATGGGIVLSPYNRQVMKRKGTVVYLKASIDLLLARTRHDKNRPLLQGPNRKQNLTKLLNEREPLYEEIADIIVQSKQQSAAKLTQYLDQEIERYDACS